MMPAFLQPFWAEEITMDDEYLISDRILMRVDTLRQIVPQEMTVDTALDEV